MLLCMELVTAKNGLHITVQRVTTFGCCLGVLAVVSVL